MEGTCAKIVDESPTTVRKVLKRTHKGMSAIEQANLQQLAKQVVEECKLSTLTVPSIVSIDSKSYVMERVDDSKPLYEVSPIRADWKVDLQLFLHHMEQKGWYMNDIECYVQPNNCVAIIDFDKCERIGDMYTTRKYNPFFSFFHN